MHIYLNASEIAGLINKNKYNSQEDVIYDILCRIKKETNKSDINKLEIINKSELLDLLKLFNESSLLDSNTCNKFKETIKTTPSDKLSSISKDILDNAAKQSVNTKNTEESRQIQNNIETNIKKVMKTKNIENVKSYVDGHINKTRGIVNENKIITSYEKKNNTKIYDNNSKLYKMKLFTIDDYKIYICGKIDGIEDNKLIEIKNRRNRLFEFIPLYEQIQIEVYFRLTNLKEGKLIQNYNDTTSEFPICCNAELWATIQKDLIEACKIIISQL